MFLAHAKVRLDPLPEAVRLNSLLAQAWEHAHASWPTVELAPELFVRHLAERLPGPSPALSLETLLQQLSLGELYLACACLHAVPMAVELFEQNYLQRMRKRLEDREGSAASLDEICQLARARILDSTPEGPPRIAEYTGQGLLIGWVRSIGARIASTLSTGFRRRSTGDAESYELIILKLDAKQLQIGSDPEQAQARLAAVTPEAYLFRVGLEAIAHYDWARHGLTLTAEATAGLLEALANESRPQRPYDLLAQLTSDLLEHTLYTRGFLVALDGVPRYGGIFLFAMSQMAIDYPVMRATLAAGHVTFYQLPTHIPFAQWDPGAGDSPPAEETIARQVQAEWAHPSSFMQSFVMNKANSEDAREFRALLNDRQVHALLARTGKLGRDKN